MQRFQTVIGRARFVYSPYPAYEMQGFVQVLADAIRARIQSGQNIYDQPAAPLRPSARPRSRKFHIVGTSRGDNGLLKKQAEVERDKFLATIKKPTIQEKIADGLVLFGKMVEKYRAAHVEAQVGGRYLLAKPTREKYLLHLEQRIVPKWSNRRLCEIPPDEVQQWLFETHNSWHMMNDLRGLISGVYTKAEAWGYWPEGRRNPISRVEIGEKWSVRPERILSE